jgi:hypothetical protein
MDSATKLEIAWRQELLARLQAPLNVLKRKAGKEQEKRLARARALSGYESAEEAHDAYGYGEITYAEYLLVEKHFNHKEHADGEAMTAAEAALDELQGFTRRLQSQIKDLKWSALPEEEKQRIQASNEAYRAELHERTRRK